MLDTNKILNTSEYKYYELKTKEKLNVKIISKDLIKKNLAHDTIKSYIIKDTKKFHDLLNLNNVKAYSLLFRATRDGFGAEQFHSKCDGIKHTVMVAKSDKDFVFGGYTDLAWHSNNSSNNTNKSFLFSLNRYTKHMVKNDKSGDAILCSKNYGPQFG